MEEIFSFEILGVFTLVSSARSTEFSIGGFAFCNFELINGEWSIAVKMPIDENTLASTRAFHGIDGRVRVAAQDRSVRGITA